MFSKKSLYFKSSLYPIRGYSSIRPRRQYPQKRPRLPEPQPSQTYSFRIFREKGYTSKTGSARQSARIARPGLGRHSPAAGESGTGGGPTASAPDSHEGLAGARWQPARRRGGPGGGAVAAREAEGGGPALSVVRSWRGAQGQPRQVLVLDDVHVVCGGRRRVSP